MSGIWRSGRERRVCVLGVDTTDTHGKRNAS
jgi:hypothetical protein